VIERVRQQLQIIYMPKIFELCPKSTGFVTELEDLCSFIFAIPFLVSQLIRRRNRTGDDMHPRLMLVLTHFTIYNVDEKRTRFIF